MSHIPPYLRIIAGCDIAASGREKAKNNIRNSSKVLDNSISLTKKVNCASIVDIDKNHISLEEINAALQSIILNIDSFSLANIHSELNCQNASSLLIP